MKITDIEVIELRVPGFDASIYDSSWSDCVIRIRTDEGITGISEVDSVPSVVKAIVEASPYHSQAMGLKAVLIGQDPLEPAALWERMYEGTYLYGRRGAVIHAVSGIDIALWDIRGKALSKPVAALLGGEAKRQKVRAYGTVYPLGQTKDEMLRNVDRALARGLRALKICAEPAWRTDFDQAAGIVRMVRGHVGPQIALMLDGVAVWHNAEEVLALLPVLRDQAIGWLEAPLPLENLDGYARVQGHGVPIGGGDLGMTTRHEFLSMLDQGKADILQPDITMAGGYTELMRISQAARLRGKRVVLHGHKSNILNAVNLNFLSQHWGDEMLEYSLSPSPLLSKLTNEDFPVDGDGMVPVPTGPGIGVTLNEEIVAAYCVR
jgi:L-rhamnonate dehydratase